MKILEPQKKNAVFSNKPNHPHLFPLTKIAQIDQLHPNELAFSNIQASLMNLLKTKSVKQNCSLSSFKISF